MAAIGMCETPGCKSIAQLQCPTCIKLGIQGSFFCNQDCFKKSWKTHKIIHSLAKGESKDGSNVEYNPWPSYNFTGKLRPFPAGPKRTVPPHIGRPDYADHPTGFPTSENAVKGSGLIKVLDDEEIEGMRVACRLGREVLDEAAKVCDVGVTTDEIDRVVHEACIERECYPSPLNYHQFPNSCCTSVNEVICHGIPDLRPLQDGDICNVDVTVYHRGFHGDLNETFFVGNVPESSQKLVQVTYECLQKAIAIVKPGEKYREIGNVIQKHAQANGLSVVRSYCGHGIHRLFHTAPNVPHYAKNKAVGVMKPGHCFTIEPMINEGGWRDEQWPDHWTAVTADGSRSAQPYSEGHLQFRANVKDVAARPSLEHCSSTIQNKAVGVMKPGHCFTIEPMINEGGWRDEQWPDHWTAVTADGSRSAQFEQTLLVTETGCDILTARASGRPWFMDQLEKLNANS